MATIRSARCRRGTWALRASVWGGWSLVLVLGFTAGKLAAQPSEVDRPPLTLDTVAMLSADAVLPSRIEGRVWRFEQGEGRRLVALPVRLPVADVVTRYDTSALHLRGGRLLAWRIPAQPVPAAPTLLGPSVASGETRTQDPPLLTRELDVHPDGTLHWKLDRVLPGASVAPTNNLYGLLLDRQRLLDLAPADPERLTRNSGESTADYQQRRLAAMNAYRDAAGAYRDLKAQIRDLPDQFSQPLPPRVEAVFEIRDSVQTLEISGYEPLPWQLGIADLRSLAQAVGSGAGRGGAEPSDAASTMLELLDRWPAAYTDRLVADALAAVLDAGNAPLGPALHKVAQALLGSEDPAARRTVLRAVVEAGLSPEAQSLIAAAATDDDDVVGLYVLRGLVRMRAGVREELAELLPRVNALVADERGAGAAAVVQVLAGVVDGGGLDADQIASILDVFGPGVNLGAAPADQRGAMIDAVLNAAGSNRLAANWLDRALLGHDDPQVVGATLSAIEAMRSSTDTQRPSGDAQAAPARLRLDSLDHQLLVQMASVDEARRDLAWRAALQFEIARLGAAGGAARDDGLTAIYLAAARTAIAHTPTPPQALPFFMSQPQAVGRAAALMVLIGEGDPALVRQAVPAFMGVIRGDRSAATDAMAQLTPVECDAFAAGLHLAQTGKVSAVTSLLRLAPRSRGVSLHQWLGERLADGEIPPDSAWLQAVGGESTLLDAAASQEPAILRAAAAALVASQGGDEKSAAALAQDFLALSEPTAYALRQAWAKQGSLMLLRQFEDVAGRYRLVVQMGGGDGPPAPAESPAALMAQLKGNVLDLGEVRLQTGAEGLAAVGLDLTFGVRITDDRRALILARPMQLNATGAEGLAQLMLEHQAAMTLTEIRAGFWWASFTTLAMQNGQIMLVRAGD